MVRFFSKRFALLSSVVVGLVLPGDVFGFTLFSVGGNSDPGSIQPEVDAFRAALGEPNNGNAAGPLASGRREINWDGGGANGFFAFPRDNLRRLPEHSRRTLH